MINRHHAVQLDKYIQCKMLTVAYPNKCGYACLDILYALIEPVASIVVLIHTNNYTYSVQYQDMWMPNKCWPYLYGQCFKWVS